MLNIRFIKASHSARLRAGTRVHIHPGGVLRGVRGHSHDGLHDGGCDGHRCAHPRGGSRHGVHTHSHVRQIHDQPRIHGSRDGSQRRGLRMDSLSDGCPHALHFLHGNHGIRQRSSRALSCRLALGSEGASDLHEKAYGRLMDRN